MLSGCNDQDLCRPCVSRIGRCRLLRYVDYKCQWHSNRRLGHLEHFTGMLIAKNGKVVRLVRRGEPPVKADVVIDEHGRTLLPGFIDAHGHVLALGRDALRLDLVG